MALCLYGISQMAMEKEGDNCKVLNCLIKDDGLVYLRVYMDDPAKYKDDIAWCEPNCPDLNSTMCERDRVIHCCYLERDGEVEVSSIDIWCRNNYLSKTGYIMFAAVSGIAISCGLILSTIILLICSCKLKKLARLVLSKYSEIIERIFSIR